MLIIPTEPVWRLYALHREATRPTRRRRVHHMHNLRVVEPMPRSAVRAGKSIAATVWIEVILLGIAVVGLLASLA